MCAAMQIDDCRSMSKTHASRSHACSPDVQDRVTHRRGAPAGNVVAIGLHDQHGGRGGQGWLPRAVCHLHVLGCCWGYWENCRAPFDLHLARTVDATMPEVWLLLCMMVETRN